MKLKLGYRSVWADDVEFKGHEFHYSLISEDDNQKADYPCKSARGKEVDMPIYKSTNAWSSYFHIYLGEIDKMKAFIDLLIDE